jgi:hypothetical protein
MEYQKFINIIAQNQTARVKPFNLPESSSPWPIPENFQVLLPDVINTIEKNFDILSDKRKFIAIFGFQPTGIAIESDDPILKNRIFLPDQIRSHLSCAIYYLTIDDLRQPHNWAHYKTLVVDFTNGLIMNGNYYLQIMGMHVSGGKVLGKISSRKLKQAWHRYQNKNDIN